MKSDKIGLTFFLTFAAFAVFAGENLSLGVPGGAVDNSNCQMLCKAHNRAKGNR